MNRVRCLDGHVALAGDRLAVRRETVHFGFQFLADGRLMEQTKCRACGTYVYVTPELLDVAAPTVGQLWAEYARRNVATAHHHAFRLSAILEHLGSVEVTHLAATNMDVYGEIRIAAGLDRPGLAREQQALRSLLKWALASGFIQTVPSWQRPRPPRPPQRRRSPPPPPPAIDPGPRPPLTAAEYPGWWKVQQRAIRAKRGRTQPF